MKIKEQYHRFKEWQLHPIENKESHEQHHCNNCGSDFTGNFCPTCGHKYIDYKESHEQHHCSNCGGDFTGNFCPTCGQKWNVDNITWNNLRQDIMDFRGFGTLSPIFTLWQLLLRPGYLIGDYISGKRQLCYPPLKLLVMVGAVVFFMAEFLDTDSNNKGIIIELFYDGEKGIDMWLSSHFDWAILIFFGFMILPTFTVFRYSPCHSFHTLPQGFYIQLFQAIQFLCLLIIYSVFGGVFCMIFGLKEPNLTWFFIPLLIYLFYNYKQLFGYSYWNTLWRIVYCCMLSLILASLLISPFQIRNGYDLNTIVLADIFLLLISLPLVHIIHTINRCNYGQQPHRSMWKWYNILIIVVYGIITSYTFYHYITELLKYFQNPDMKRDDNMEIGIIASLILASLIGVYIVEARKPDKETGLPSD